MRIVEAARLLTTGRISPEILWDITTSAERITIALLAGRPDYLPSNAKTPVTKPGAPWIPVAEPSCSGEPHSTCDVASLTIALFLRLFLSKQKTSQQIIRNYLLETP